MFNKLVASGGKRKSFWSPTTIATSVVLHALLVAGAVAANAGYDPTAKKDEELVDYVDVKEDKPKPPEPEPEKPKEPEPPKPEPEKAAPPVVKGFQELQPPQEPPKDIPKVDPNQQAVKEQDFSGQGKAGGVQDGVEKGVAQSTVERETPPDQGVYDISAVEVRPSLSNGSEIQRALERNYPPLLRDAGVGGTVTLSFRVNEDGKVDPESISVVSSDNDQFTDAAKKVVERMRFRPAKVNDRPVKVLVSLPVTFQPQS